MSWNLLRWLAASSVVTLLALAANMRQASAQQDDIRGWNEKLQDARQKAGQSPPPGPDEVKPPSGKVPVTQTPSPNRVQEAFIGFTVWVHRESIQSDPEEIRGFSHGNLGERKEWTALRHPADVPLKVGERASISVEVTRSGYLYIVDQELYSDGSRGAPALIFPTTKLRKGNNRVSAGRMITIPGPADDPPFFEVTKKRSGLVADEFTVLVSQDRLEGIVAEEGEQEFDEAVLLKVQKTWARKAKGPLSAREAGTLYSVAERKASLDSILLAPSAPLPQSLFRVEYQAGETIAVKIPIRIDNSPKQETGQPPSAK
jgi:hypothetical protein